LTTGADAVGTLVCVATLDVVGTLEVVGTLVCVATLDVVGTLDLVGKLVCVATLEAVVVGVGVGAMTLNVLKVAKPMAETTSQLPNWFFS